uniref:Reverse transcriptase Ty1/copia-type domain-containing protein n=1 Tax=Tanacetum cinerariifolium TaxID=118510 RepID=A0A6L2LJS3_TANCI|nr:hypothetical protein [Tanacetum cinerariifolium]
MNYEPIVAGTQSNGFTSTKASDNICQAIKEIESVKDYILLPLWTADPPFSQDSKSSNDDGSKPSSNDRKKVDEDPRKENKCNDQEKEDNVNNTNNVNNVSSIINTASINEDNELLFDPNMPALKDVSIFNFSSDDEDNDAVANMNNLDTTIQDPSWIKAMQEELLQFKLQDVWTLVDLSNRKRAIGTKWVFRNKKDERGNVIRNKERLVAQGYTQDEGINNDEVFTPVTRIEIKEEVYVCQPPGFEDSDFSNRVYKVEKAIYGLHQAPKAWKELCNAFERLMYEIFQMSYLRELTFFLGLQDEADEEVDVHMYRFMIGSLMYLTSSRPNIMFVVCADARYQVNPKVSHLYAVKMIFRVLYELVLLFMSLKFLLLSIIGTAGYTSTELLLLVILTTVRKSKRKDTRVPRPSGPTEYVADEDVHKELGDSLVRAATTASSLEIEQDSGNITKIQSKATPNESSSQGTNSGGGLRCQETIGDTIAQTRVLDLEKTKTTRRNEIDSLKRRVKKLKKRNRSRTYKLKGLYKDKGKGITIEEHVKPKKKEQIRLDEEAVLKLQAEFDKEERLARER